MAGGPGGKEVGRVSVRVTPDTSRFDEELKAKLEALERKLKGHIPVEADFDPDGLKQKVRAAAKAAETSAKVKVDIDENNLSGSLRRHLGAVQAQARDIKLPPLFQEWAKDAASFQKQWARLEQGLLAPRDISTAARVAKALADQRMKAEAELAKARRRWETEDLRFAQRRARFELNERIRLGEKSREDLKSYVDSHGDAIAKLKEQFDEAFGDAATKRKFRLFGEGSGKQFNRGLVRGLLRVRIDRTIFERAGFALGRSLSTPVFMLTKLAGAAALATAALGPLMGAIAPLAGAIAGLGSGLAQAVPALNLLPGLLSTAAASLGVLVAGFKGMGDAISAATPGDLEAALKKLAPNARKAAMAFRSLRPEFQLMRRVIQQNLWAGLDKDIRALGTSAIPALRRGLKDLARGFNGVFKDVLRFGRSRETVDAIRESLRNMVAGLKQARPGFTSLLEGFRDLTRVGTRFLPRLGKAFSKLAKQWADGIEKRMKTGELEKSIGNALDKITQLGRIIKNVFKGIGNVFRIAEKSSGGLLDKIEAITASFERWTKSVRGEQTLGKVFDSLRRAGDAMSPVFKTLFRTLADLTPLLADITEAVAPGLQEIIKAFGEGFKSISPEIGPLLGSIAKTLARMIPVVMQLLPPFLRLLDAILKPMASVVELLVPPLRWLADAISGVLGALSGTGLDKLAVFAGGLLLLKKRMPGAFAFLRGGKLGRDAKTAAGGVTALAASTDKAAKAGGRMQRLVRGAGKGGLFGLALAVTGSKEVAKVLDDTTSVVGETLDLSIAGFRGLAAAVTGNEEALRNIRKEYGGTVKEIKNFVSGANILKSAIRNVNSTLEKGPRKVTWIDRFWGRVTRELKEMHELVPALDSMLGFPGAVDRLRELGVPLDVLNRAIGRNLVDIPKLQKALETIEMHKLGVDVDPAKLNRAYELIRGTFGKIEKEMKSAFSNGMKAIDNVTAKLPNTFPKPFRMAMNASMKVVTGGFGGMLNFAGSFMPKLNNSANKFNPAPKFKKGTDKAKETVGSGLAELGKAIRRGASRAAEEASGFANRLKGFFDVDLSSKGASMMNSLASGIRAAAGGPISAALWAMQQVSGLMQNSPAKWGPFSGKGYTLIRGQVTMNDFARGIRDAAPNAIGSTLKAMTGVSTAMTANDLARSAGADWIGEYSKGIESQADKVNAAIMTATARGGEINSAVRHQVAVDEAKPIEDRIAAAMSGWTMQQNRDATWRMVKKGDKSRSRR